MTGFVRAAGAFVLLLLGAGVAPAASEKEIDAAINRGADALKRLYRGRITTDGIDGIGPVALAGVALIEAKVPVSDPTLAGIAQAIRAASYTESKTYQLCLCMIFLNQLEDPKDIPLIQMMAVRLLAGQNGAGGWSYNTVMNVTRDQEAWLRAKIRPEKLANGEDKKPVLHPAVKEYQAALAQQSRILNSDDDNSNTQFAIIAIWESRKHGVPVENALRLIEKRFLMQQDRVAGGWSYKSQEVVPMGNSPAMTCAGLIGLGAGAGRRASEEATKTVAKPSKKGDSFFTPTTKNAAKEEKKANRQSPAIRTGLASLGGHFLNVVRNWPIREHPMYTLWSIERVGVLYNVQKIGGIDWYQFASNYLVKAQRQDGTWGGPVDTAFAILILCRADLARDLSSKFRDSKVTELRAGTSGAATSGNSGTPSAGGSQPIPTDPDATPLPLPVKDKASQLASQLLLTPPTGWTKALEKLRDTKGGDNTTGLVLAIHRLDGNRKKEAREALAERLTRMSAKTLKSMMAGKDAELRRGAVLAGAMKDDKTHVPDLIDRLTDDDDLVVRAARAGLKSLTSQDFGPKSGASKSERQAAAAAWTAWLKRQK